MMKEKQNYVPDFYRLIVNGTGMGSYTDDKKTRHTYAIAYAETTIWGRFRGRFRFGTNILHFIYRLRTTTIYHLRTTTMYRSRMQLDSSTT